MVHSTEKLEPNALDQAEPKIGLSLLSWRSPVTLSKTLQALQSLPVDFFADRVVFFQEISQEDRRIAEKFGYRAEGNNKNVGIRDGIQSAISCCNAEIVLYLECDCLLIETAEQALLQIQRAARRISCGDLKVVRMRHTEHPGYDYVGYKKFLRYWPSVRDQRLSRRLTCELRRLIRPDKAVRLIGQAVMDSDQADQRFPKWIKKLEDGLLRVNSRVIPWTNQSILVDKHWLLNTLYPYAVAHPRSNNVNGFPSLEPPLNCAWWRKQEFPVGQSLPGLFTHYRVDRPQFDQKTLLHGQPSDEDPDSIERNPPHGVKISA